jgi:hypothetical protein
MVPWLLRSPGAPGLMPFMNLHVRQLGPSAKRSGRPMPKLTPSLQKPETEFELD